MVIHSNGLSDKGQGDRRFRERERQDKIKRSEKSDQRLKKQEAVKNPKGMFAREEK